MRRGGQPAAFVMLSAPLPLLGSSLDLGTLLDSHFVQAVGILVGTILAAYGVEFLVRRVLLTLARKTATDLDDQVVEALRRPIFLSVICGGLAWTSDTLQIEGFSRHLVHAALQSIAVIVWAVAAFRVASAILHALAGRPRPGVVRPASLPVFLIVTRVTLIAASMYFGFLAWNIDLTAWLASAGIIGIAVGFAAKDTLANLFAGVFILADAPYEVGDYIVVDGTMRGKVVRIGMRSTRLLARDDIEITIPNAIIGSSRIINEAGGPIIEQRVRIKVFAAYGCDIDRVREVLLRCADDVPHVARDPAPQVRLRELGESGLRLELLVWCDDASTRGVMIDDVTTRVYKAFQREGLEIPYNKLDVYVKGDGAKPAQSRLAAALAPPSLKL
jgi:small-conductance mechanosensitive channel